jgi:hypothetical protein
MHVFRKVCGIRRIAGNFGDKLRSTLNDARTLISEIRGVLFPCLKPVLYTSVWIKE